MAQVSPDRSSSTFYHFDFEARLRKCGGAIAGVIQEKASNRRLSCQWAYRPVIKRLVARWRLSVIAATVPSITSPGYCRRSEATFAPPRGSITESIYL